MEITIDTQSSLPKVIIDGHEIDGSQVSQEMRVATDHGIPYAMVTLTFLADRLVHISPAGTTTVWEDGSVTISGSDKADVLRTAGLDGKAEARRDIEAEVDAEAHRRVEAKMAEMKRGRR